MSFIEKQLDKLWEYLSNPELWLALLAGAFRIVMIVFLAWLVVRVFRKIVDKLFVQRRSGPIRIPKRREDTLTKLIKNVVAYVVYFMAIVMVLQVFNFQIGPLLAGAGVAGLAIGFGAQNLVRDVISGFFIIFEDQFAVGDYISTAGVEGTVDEIGLRTSKIVSWTGELNIVPNGNITQVINYSARNGLAVVDVNVPYESDVAQVEKIIQEVAETLPDKYEFILSVPEVIGVQNLDVSHFVVRVIAETEPVFKWAGERNIRKEIQDKLYKSGVKIPAPRIVTYSEEQVEELTQERLRNRG
ncbi:mechanosensitive ion channel family protein [Oceanobacillus sp. J11TS1]|uniref:mechanosensitive ion channel family protein n=1 Tax=Oceanobacillus sp. J11TS1 TaxID=2807191 RepID=UPI001B100D87|nr:mechanosensitive ion channel family protein [Oceanobacillus sp. J11TS1]GIO23975.1 mechanosensitive ion channel protein MscS [Oceanobacillus sp. J11TS1]